MTTCSTVATTCLAVLSSASSTCEGDSGSWIRVGHSWVKAESGAAWSVDVGAPSAASRSILFWLSCGLLGTGRQRPSSSPSSRRSAPPLLHARANQGAGSGWDTPGGGLEGRCVVGGCRGSLCSKLFRTVLALRAVNGVAFLGRPMAGPTRRRPAWSRRRGVIASAAPLRSRARAPGPAPHGWGHDLGVT